MSTAKLLRWLQEHTVYSEFESTVLQPRGDHVPSSSEESQNTQVWFDAFVCDQNKYKMTQYTPAETEFLQKTGLYLFQVVES